MYDLLLTTCGRIYIFADLKPLFINRETPMPRLPVCLINLALLLTLTSNIYAEDSGIYIGGIAGASLRSDSIISSPSLGSQPAEFKPGYTFGGFVGYDFGNHLRLEAEISYRENDLRTGAGKDPQAAASTIMLNGYYDFYLDRELVFDQPVNLYFGGGFGVATAQLETISLGQAIDANESVFAYQIEAGVGWNYSSKVNFSVGYRFFDAADPEFVLPLGQRVRMELENHEIILKMRYLFNL